MLDLPKIGIPFNDFIFNAELNYAS